MTTERRLVHDARRRRLRGLGAALAVLMLVPIGAASAKTDAGAAPAASTAAAAQSIDSRPPAVWLASGDRHLKVAPYSGCWQHGGSGMCFDGPVPKPLPSLGKVADPVTLAFARADWHFKVTVVDRDGHRTKITLKPLTDRSWRLALGKLDDGRYRVDIFGRGPQGDLAAAADLTLV